MANNYLQNSTISSKIKKNRSKQTIKTAVVCLSLAFVFGNSSMVVAQPVGLPSMGSASAAELSPLVEKTLGDAIMEQGRHDPTYISDLAVNQYLTELGHSLANYAPKAIGQDITVFAVRDPSINAFAMPGGYIGINTGLVTTSKSESELASVVAHEIGHVMQRHIARGLSEQSKSTNIMIASLVGAVLAAMAGQPDLAMGVATFGQAAGIDRQLGFSRSAEQEADRAGLQMLSNAGYDPMGMVGMFKNLMKAANLNEGIRNPYASTHPLSIQRMSDMENRVSTLAKKQYRASDHFWFIKNNLAVTQARDNSARRQLEQKLNSELQQYQGVRLAATYYGLALLAKQSNNNSQADKYLLQARSIYNAPEIDLLGIKLAMLKNKQDSLAIAKSAAAKWPNDQAIAYEYAVVLQANGQYQQASKILKGAIDKWPHIPEFQRLIATAYKNLGENTMANEAMANFYEQTGAYGTAVELLQQARAQSKDFYAQSRIDTRIRDIRERLDRQRELLKPFEN